MSAHETVLLDTCDGAPVAPHACAPWPFPPYADGQGLSGASLPALQLRECAPEGRAQAEALIRERFARAYGARIHAFMPRLFSVGRPEGALRGACGLREAGREPLFLECYLDAPVETAIGKALGHRVERASVVEVGQFAGASAGAFRCMIRLLTARLHAEGQRWVVFTGTQALRNAFHRLGLKPQVLAPADPARLSLAAYADWGSYYRHAPMVMCGDIAEGYRQIAAEAAQ